MSDAPLTAADHYLLKTLALSPDGCWRWAGAKNVGYGTFKVDGRNIMAHRWAYETYTGEVIGKRHAHHTCQNRGCVNPRHIEIVTVAEHVNIHVAKTRREMTHCKRGHEFTEANIYHRTGRRHCRTCRAEHAKEHKGEYARRGKPGVKRTTT
jgi:hypothetical protein